MIKKYIKPALLFYTFSIMSVIGNAQPTGGGPGGGAEPVPISGIEWLLLIGGILGIRKFYLQGKRR